MKSPDKGVRRGHLFWATTFTSISAASSLLLTTIVSQTLDEGLIAVVSAVVYVTGGAPVFWTMVGLNSLLATCCNGLMSDPLWTRYVSGFVALWIPFIIGYYSSVRSSKIASKVILYLSLSYLVGGIILFSTFKYWFF